MKIKKKTSIQKTPMKVFVVFHC